MDPDKLKDVYERLEALDDRLGHRIRMRSGASRESLEQIEDRLRTLVTYTSELRDLVRDLVLAFASRQPTKS